MTQVFISTKKERYFIMMIFVVVLYNNKEIKIEKKAIIFCVSAYNKKEMSE
jgi:hypothetical protein